MFEILDKMFAALVAAEEHDESVHAFDDLECFVDDPETHDAYITEYKRRWRQRNVITSIKETFLY